MNAIRFSSMPALRRLTAILGLAAGVSAASAATFDFTGDLQAAGGNGQPWVLGSFMWGTIETGSGQGTSQSGFSYFDTHAIGSLTFTFGDLEMTSSQSPGPGLGGFEYYSEDDASVMPFTINLSGVPIATGTSVYLRTEVDNDSDITAIGTGRVVLTTPGADPAFFNEVMALTGNTGILDVSLTSFFPVNDAGLFSTAGSFTTVPEPGEYAAVAGAGLAGLALWRRRARKA